MSTTSSVALTSTAAQRRINILGVGVSAITANIAVGTIDDWVQHKSGKYVCVTGAHGIIESRRDARLREIHDAAGMVTPDGMPLVFMAHRLGFKFVTRVYGPDLMERLSALSAQKRYRQFYYGGGPGVAAQLATALGERHPGLIVAGTLTPPFRPMTLAEREAAIATINAVAPDIVWIGLSTPKQEYWMASHVARLNGAVLIGVGAAFDFLSGNKAQAPLWMQARGLEWAFRLASEPRRLLGRYTVVVPLFAALAAGQLLRRMFAMEQKGVHSS